MYPAPLIANAAQDGFTYLRLDMGVINDGRVPASNIIVKLAVPPSVETVAQYYAKRQPTTPGEGELNISTAEITSTGYRLATNMLMNMPPLQGNDVIAYKAGTAVVFAKNGEYKFYWVAFCLEDGGAGTEGAFAVKVEDGTASVLP